MAKRLLFRPSNEFNEYVKETEIDFEWKSPYTYGKEATQRNLERLHSEIVNLCNIDYDDILEVSGACSLGLGKNLSAFNLGIEDKNHKGMYKKNKYTVESLYQGSKVFEDGGPHHELYTYASSAAKYKIREKQCGGIIGFNYHGIEYPSEPKDAFYNWLYCTILCNESNKGLINSLINRKIEFFGFTDIFFNHKQQIACQARAIAIFMGMIKRGYSINKITDFNKHVEIRNRIMYEN